MLALTYHFSALLRGYESGRRHEKPTKLGRPLCVGGDPRGRHAAIPPALSAASVGHPVATLAAGDEAAIHAGACLAARCVTLRGGCRIRAASRRRIYVRQART